MRLTSLRTAVIPLTAALALAAAGPGPAQTWTGAVDRNWGTTTAPTNWNPNTVPNSNTAAVIFGGASPGAINFAAGGTAFTVNSLTFSAGGYTLDAAGTLTFAGTAPALSNTTGTNVINSRLVATGLTANVGGGTLTLGNVRGGASANSIDASSTFTVTTGGTLDAVMANSDLFNGTNTSSSLGNAQVALNGGTLNLRGNLVAGGLAGQVYQLRASDGTANAGIANFNNTHPDFTGNAGRVRSLFATGTPETLGPPNAGSTAGLDRVNTFTSQGNGNAFGSFGSAQTTNYVSRWSGVVNITTAGNYTFGTRSDDGSLLYVDGNLVANNNFYQGMTTRSGTVNGLTAGPHTVDIYWYQGGGGAGLLAGYSGPDNNNIGLGSSDASIQAAAFPAAATFARQGTVDLANPITVAAGSSSTVNVTNINTATVPTLTVNPSANLTVGGTQGLLRAATTTLAGSGTRTFTVNPTTSDLAVGQLNTGGGAVTLIKTGAGNLVFDASSAPNLGGGTLTYNVQGGRLVSVSDSVLDTAGVNVLGVNSPVQLSGGGTWQMRTRLSFVTFDNPLTVSGTGGTVEAVPNDQTGLASFQLGGGPGGNGITLSAGTLTFDVFGGGDGGNVDVYGTVTGAGNVAKSTGTGSVTFHAGNTYTGTTTVSAGTLIGEANTSFGTGAGATITVNNGGTLGLRGNITVGNAISINGPGAGGRSGALEATSATTFAGSPVYNGNITLAGDSAIGMASDSVAPSFTINGNINTGTSTTRILTLNPAGGASDTSQMVVNGVISGSGNLAKTGALTAVLTANNTYAGTTTVNSGTLEARGAGGRAVGAGAAFVNGGSTLLVSQPNALGDVPVTLSSLNSTVRFATGGTTTSNATAYTANEGSVVNVTAGSTVNLPSATLAMTAGGTFFGLREGWVRTNQDYTTPNPNNGINGGVVTNIRMASITARTQGPGTTDPGPSNNFSWSDNTTFIYTGQIQARVTGVMQFAEQIDDNVRVIFNGTPIGGGPANNGTDWFHPTSTTAVSVVAGQWYPFEVRMAQGGGGAGPPGSNANGGWGVGWTTSYGFGMYESATGPLGDGTAFSPGSTGASQTDPRVNGANYFKPGEAGDPLFDPATGTSTRFRADAIAASLNIDAGSSLSVKQMTGGGLITLTGSGGSGASLTLNNAAAAIASSAGQVTYAGDTLSTLTVGTNQTFTLSGGVVTPAATVTFSKAGTGTMIVNGPTNLGAGSTFRIDGGTVRFNGVGTGTGAVLVANTGTIGGTGTVPGAVTIGSGGAVAPGNSVGLLSTGAETWQPNSKYLFEYASTDQSAVSAAPPGTLNDSLNIAGALAINATNVAGQKFTIDIAPFGLGSSPVQYVIATATSISGFSADKFAFTGTGFAAGTAQVLLGGPSNNQLILQFQPVPEPAFVLLACGGLAGVVGWARRRRAA